MNDDKEPAVLRDFLNYLRVMNYSEKTIREYTLDLLCFFEFLKGYMGLEITTGGFNVFILEAVKEADVIAFLVYLNFYRDNTGGTRQRKLSTIRCFYKWLIRHYPKCSKMRDPTKEVDNIRRVKRLPKSLNLTEAKRLMCVFTSENCKYPIRNNMILFLFLNTGLRLSELASLNVENIHFEGMYIEVVGKGDKERKIFMSCKLKKRLKDYLYFQYGADYALKNEPLFVNQQKKRLGVWGIENVCKKAFELVGLGEYGYKTHSLRHTFAMVMYEKTNDILLVKKLLGHDCIESTEIYARAYPERVREAVDKNPLSSYFDEMEG